MGVKSTYAISRKTAQQVLLGDILSLSNEELADALEILPQSTYRNYRVYDSDEDVRDEEWNNGLFTIQNISEFF